LAVNAIDTGALFRLRASLKLGKQLEVQIIDDSRDTKIRPRAGGPDLGRGRPGTAFIHPARRFMPSHAATH